MLQLSALLKKILPHPAMVLGREVLNQARGVSAEPLTHEAIAALIGKPNPVILEIGCNDGSDTEAFLRMMPQAKIYCFEPDPRAIARFKSRIGTNIDRVKLFEGVISDRTGALDFHQSAGGDTPDGWDLSGSIRRPKNHLIEHDWVKFEKTIQVRTWRLDDWCIENGVKHVDFIWMDVQGAEGDVIAGAQNILQNTRFIYTEYSNKELYDGQLSLKQLLSRMPSFKVVTRYWGDVLLKNKNIAHH